MQGLRLPYRSRWLLGLAVAAAIVYVVRIDDMMVDYAVFRTAGVRAIAGEELFRPRDGHYQYKYFPAFAFAMAPFAAVSSEAGEAVWFALSLGFLVLFVGGCVRALPSPRLTERQLTWLAVILVGRFYVRELALGQTNALLGALLVAALMAAQAGRRGLSGALVGAAIFVKPYALIFIPWLLVAHGLAAVAACAGVVAAGLALPAVVYGWQGNLDLLAGWYRTVTETTQPNLLIPENISIATMWAKWLGPGSAAQSLAIATLVATAGLVGLVLWRRRGVSEPNYLEFGLLMLLIPLFSPQGWDYVLLLGTPVVLCLLDRLPAMPGGWRLLTAAAVLVTSFTIFDLVGRMIYTTFMAISILTVAALVQAGLLARLRWLRLS